LRFSDRALEATQQGSSFDLSIVMRARGVDAITRYLGR
jgi:hypothetical protein